MKNKQTAGRLIAIGDIHGHNLALRGSLSRIQPSHEDVIVKACRDSHVTESFAFTHANFCRFTPFAYQLSSILRWTGIDEMEICSHESGMIAVVGHSAGEDIRDLGTCVCIDTGCGFGGLLSAYMPATKDRWQVTEVGQSI